MDQPNASARMCHSNCTVAVDNNAGSHSGDNHCHFNLMRGMVCSLSVCLLSNRQL